MDYQKIYNKIINRAQNRILEGYVEKHHIIPRCMGGTDDADNLVTLTAREHYVCHQLLTKIYPTHKGLALAAHMMCAGRSNNRLYEWVRTRHANAMSEAQMGSGNNNYGTRWVHKDGEVIKANTQTLQYYLDLGYKRGKVSKEVKKQKKLEKVQFCKKCGSVKNECTRKEICTKHQMINTLIRHFGFNIACLGTSEFYTEYDRIVEKLHNEYHVELLSTLQLAEKYNVSSQRIDSIFKSLGIPKRTISEALKNFTKK